MQRRDDDLSRRVRIIFIAFAGVVALVAIAILPGALSTRDAVDAQRNRWTPAAASARELLSSALNQETGERGYVITADPRFLAPYTQGRAESAATIARLRALAGSDAIAARAVETYSRRLAAWQQDAEGEIAAVRRGDLAGAQADVASGAGRQRFDELRAAQSQLVSIADARMRSASRRIDRANLLLLLALGAAVAVAIAIGVAARRWLRSWARRRDDERAMEQRLAEQGRLLDRMARSTSDPIFIKDADGTYVFANAAADDAQGMAMLGRSTLEVFGPARGAEVLAEDAHVRTSGVSEVIEQSIGRRVFRTTKSPFEFADGTIGVVGVAHDITEQVAAQRRDEAAARISRAVAAARTPVEVAHAAREVLIEVSGADVVWVLVADVATRSLGVVLADGTSQPLLDSFSRIPFASPTLTAETFRTGTVRVVGRDEAEAGSTTSAIFEAEELRTVAYVPMPADGIVNFGWRTRRSFDATVLRAAVEALGAAIRRTALAERERSALTEVQRALLPEIIVPSGAAIATRYEPAADVMRLGGDWYDVFAIDERRIGLAVGDVVGHGLSAAAAMGKLKAAVRALATVVADPFELLDRVDDFAATHPPMMAATLFFGVFDRADSTLQYCAAGHPPPLIADRSGGVTLLEGGRRAPLAVVTKRSPGTRSPGRATLRPDETLVLYTDGLVERRGQSIDVGIRQLAEALAREHARSVDALADALLGELLPAVRRDDTALVCLRFVTAQSRTHTWHVPSKLSAVSRFRRDLASWLEQLDVPASVRADVGLVASEAVANAIEHGYRGDPSFEVVVDAEVGDCIEMTIRDEGEWIPPVRRPDRGRGLPIMESLADSVTVEPSGTGTVVRLVRDLRPERSERSDPATVPAG